MSDALPALAARTGPLRRLFGATANYGLGQFLPQLVGFLLLKFYTDVLTPEDYGTIDAAAVAGGFLIVLMRLGIPGAVARFYYDHPEGEGLADYVTTVFIGVSVLGVAVAIGAFATAPLWVKTVAPSLSMLGVALVLVAKVASGWSDLQRRLLQAREQSRYTAILNLVSSTVLILATMMLVLGLGWGVIGSLLAEAVVSVALAVQAYTYLRSELGGRFRAELLRASAMYGVGVLPTHLLAALAPLISRAMLAGFESVAAVGVFAIATRFSGPLLVIGGAFNTAYGPLYFSMRLEKDSDAPARLVRVMRSAWLLGIILALGTATVGPPVLVWMTREEYHGGALLLPVLALGFVGQMAYWLFANEIFFAKRTALSTAIWVPSIAAHLLVTALTTPTLGALGAAAGVAAGSLVSGIIAMVIAVRLVSLPHRWLGLAAPLLLSVGLWGAIAAAHLPLIGQAAAGVFACAALPVLLWLAGDEGVDELVARVRSRLGRNP